MDRRDSWLDTAVSGIRFGPDRRAVRAELAGHMEDRMADLRRIFPDIPEEEAQERALAAMGDPEALKQELARVHRPWLGWLWKASHWAVYLLTFVFIIMSSGSCFDSGADRSIWGRTGAGVCHNIRDGEQAELGGYTFQITGAAYVDRPKEAEDSLQLVLRVSASRFWERIDGDTVLAGLTAAGPDGVRHDMAGQAVLRYTVKLETGVEERCEIRTGGELCRWGIGWREFSLWLPAEGWTPGDRAELAFESRLGGFSLSAPVTEKVRAA